MAVRKIDQPFKLLGKNVSLLDGIVLVGGAGVGWYFLNSYIQDQKLIKLTSEFGNNLESQQALGLLQAMNPSGISWMRDFDGTKHEAILEIAGQIKDFGKVAQAYGVLTKGDNLIKDLQADLSAENFALFTKILNKEINYVPGKTDYGFKYKVGEVLYLKAAATVRIKDVNGVWYTNNFASGTKVVPVELVKEGGVNCYLVNTYLANRGVNAKIYFPENLLEPESFFKKWFGIGAIGKITDTGENVNGGRIDRYWHKPIPNVRKFGLGNKEIQNEYLNPERVKEIFNLKSIEFGNWMTQQDRADHLAAAAISLQNLAKILNVPYSFIGLGGLLSIALGARGNGGRVMAHFERYNNFIINITKTNGSGAMAHEYGHALDNFIGIYSGEENKPFATGNGFKIKENVKPGSFAALIEKLFEGLFYEDRANNKFTFFAESIKKMRFYWHSRIEVFARTFEEYIETKGTKLGINTSYLTSYNYTEKYYPGKKLQQKIQPVMDELVSKAFSILQARKNNPKPTKETGQLNLPGINGTNKPNFHPVLNS